MKKLVNLLLISVLFASPMSALNTNDINAIVIVNDEPSKLQKAVNVAATTAFTALVAGVVASAAIQYKLDKQLPSFPLENLDTPEKFQGAIDFLNSVKSELKLENAWISIGNCGKWFAI